MTNLVPAIKDVADRANQKRIALWYIADSRLKWERFFRVLSGVMALISGASVTTLFGNASDSTTTKIFAASVAFVSGVVSLVSSIYFDSKETAKICEVTGKFLALRERSRCLILHDIATGTHGMSELKTLNKDYADYSEIVDRFLRPGFNAKFKIPNPSITWDI
jgi:hypothetical protein